MPPFHKRTIIDSGCLRTNFLQKIFVWHERTKNSRRVEKTSQFGNPCALYKKRRKCKRTNLGVLSSIVNQFVVKSFSTVHWFKCFGFYTSMVKDLYKSISHACMQNILKRTCILRSSDSKDFQLFILKRFLRVFPVVSQFDYFQSYTWIKDASLTDYNKLQELQQYNCDNYCSF